MKKQTRPGSIRSSQRHILSPPYRLNMKQCWTVPPCIDRTPAFASGTGLGNTLSLRFLPYSYLLTFSETTSSRSPTRSRTTWCPDGSAPSSTTTRGTPSGFTTSAWSSTWGAVWPTPWSTSASRAPVTRPCTRSVLPWSWPLYSVLLSPFQ